MTVAIRRPVDVSPSRLHPRSFNPNVMSDAKFNMLVDKVEEEDFTDPIKVYPATEEEIAANSEWGGGPHYWIWAGEHRWRLARIKNMEVVPCIIYDDKAWDEEAQKLRMVRDNLVHGDLDSKKFTELARSIDDNFDIDPKAFGFADDTEMEKFLLRDKEQRDKSFLDGFRQATDQKVQAVDSLSDIVSNIFQACAETVDQSYLHFCYQGNVHCVVLCSKTTKAQVDAMISHVQASGGDINDFIATAIKGGLISAQSET